MLTQTVASAVLTASITGAGLIIAIYALVIPIRRRIFKERLKRLLEVETEMKKVKARFSEGQDEPIDTIAIPVISDQIGGLRKYPKYLSYGVFSTFILFCSSAFFSLPFLISDTTNNQDFQYFTIILFSLAIATFFFTGFCTITDIHLMMSGEFEQLKRQKEKLERACRNIEGALKDLVEAGLIKLPTEDRKTTRESDEKENS